MGKLLKILGIVFLALILLIVGLLVWGHKAGSKKQEEFFQAVGSGKPESVMALLEPNLAKKVDKPVLAAWIKAVNANLGAFKELSKNGFSTKSNTSGGVKTLQSEGTAIFDKGQARSKLLFRNDRLAACSVESDKLPKDWPRDDGVEALCRERAETFLNAVLANKPDETHAMLSKSLADEVPADKFKAIVERISTKAGALKSLTCRGVKYRDEEGKRFTARLFFDIACANVRNVVEVGFVFSETTAYLNSYDFGPDVAKYAPPRPTE